HHVEKYLYHCFAGLRVPLAIKTDNDPAYCSLKFQRFCNLWGIQRDTRIPHNPTDQAIIEQAHQM
ncbi:POK19 protein, partial [Rhodinocichla rosea]|nr:POK19 protein [Rhodinocichla rosea]